LECFALGEYIARGVTETFPVEDIAVHPVKFASKPPLITSSPLFRVILTSLI